MQDSGRQTDTGLVSADDDQGQSHSAIIDGDTRLSYHDLGRLASRVAAGLAGIGIRGDELVVTKLHTRWEWIVINKALGQLGAIHVSASWALKDTELRTVLATSGAKAIIHDGSSAPDVGGGASVVTVEADNSTEPSIRRWLEQDAPEAPDHPSARLVIFTAGTTGTPKGALIDLASTATDQARVLAYRKDQAAHLPAGPWMRSLLCRPLHHLAGPVQAHGVLNQRGTLVILRKFDPVAVLELIHRHRLTHLSMVPTMVSRILDLPSDVRSSFDVTSVRVLHVGGAPVPIDLKQRAITYFSPDCLFEGYGSTELRYVTLVTPKDTFRKPGSCGRPYAGVHLRIVDSDGTDVPVGTTGEIRVDTPLRFRGYLGHPPTEGFDQQGCFCTGDLGHLDEEGFLYIDGRQKDMIIRGGVNIYPAEIEAVLMSHPSVAEAAVIGAPDRDLGEVIWAYCELRSAQKISVQELLAFLQERLAPYKVPAVIKLVDALPRNAMGKVLKRELR